MSELAGRESHENKFSLKFIEVICQLALNFPGVIFSSLAFRGSDQGGPAASPSPSMPPSVFWRSCTSKKGGKKWLPGIEMFPHGYSSTPNCDPVVFYGLTLFICCLLWKENNKNMRSSCVKSEEMKGSGQILNQSKVFLFVRLHRRKPQCGIEAYWSGSEV